MSNRIHYTNCPVCGSSELKIIFPAKDHTVSGETFVIIECKSCSLRFTQDVPDVTAIVPYYKSENYISHSDTSRGLINRLYKSVRRKTLGQKRRLVEKITGIKTGQLLDVGSGTGAFVHEMKQYGWEVTGLEPDAEAKAIAEQLYQLKLRGANEFYKLPAGSFDAITLWHVLEHVHDLPGYVTQLKALLKEDGKLFIAVPNYTSKDAAVYKQYWAAYDVPRHLYHFSPRSMKILMEKNGLQVLQHKPMWYDSFYVSLLSSKYRKGRINLIAGFWNGLLSNIKATGDVQKCSSVIYVIGK